MLGRARPNDFFALYSPAGGALEHDFSCPEPSPCLFIDSPFLSTN